MGAEITVASGTKLERWALFAEIAGAFAVVLSVAYLALQVSDNNRLLRSQAHFNALSLGQRPLEMMVENENLGADAYFRQEVQTNLGYAQFWSEGQIAFDEPFHSYVASEFAAAN